MLIEFVFFGTADKSVIYVEESDTLEEIFTSHFIYPNENTEFLVMFNGKVINTYVSLSHLGIHDGSKLIIVEVPILQKGTVEKEPQESSQEIETLSYEEHEELIEERSILERCRLADLGFNSWECDPKAQTVINELYNAEQALEAEAEEEIQPFEEFVNRTVVSKPTEICDKPLPLCFILRD